MYMHTFGNEARIVRNLDMLSEQYAVGKLAKWLFGKHMSKELFCIQARSKNATAYSRDEFETVLDYCMERLICASRRDR